MDAWKAARRLVASFASLALLALAVGPPARSQASEDGGPLAGTLYAPARRVVATYCASCHWEGGDDPKKKRALPAMRLDTYQAWSTHQSVLKGVIDKWHPDGKVMPPAGAKRQPSDAERRLLLDWLDHGSPNTRDGK